MPENFFEETEYTDTVDETPAEETYQKITSNRIEEMVENNDIIKRSYQLYQQDGATKKKIFIGVVIFAIIALVLFFIFVFLL